MMLHWLLDGLWGLEPNRPLTLKVRPISALRWHREQPVPTLRQRPVPAPRHQRERANSPSCPVPKHMGVKLPKDLTKKAPFQYSWYLPFTVKLEITLHDKNNRVFVETFCGSINLTSRDKKKYIRCFHGKEIPADYATVSILFTEADDT